MSEAAPPQSRRERLRAQTLAEIRDHAFAQVDAGGPQALSLNAIGKAMGMSGPAIYRYFKGRDELVAALVADAYAELVAELEHAAAGSARRTPAKRLMAVAAVYRAWALAHPHRYALLFGEPAEQRVEGEEAVAQIHGGMLILLDLLGQLHGGDDGERRSRLDQQLAAWADRRGAPTSSPLVLRLGVLTWTRLHGIVGLELAGVFADMRLDADLLLAAEVDAIVTAASGGT
ncbi:MAG TPA: TetR/AcrR family transcriptional regulator [Baekduia sp.]|nr:TetR/AcrR family transcriptional regulator [Baekduia sp.]